MGKREEFLTELNAGQVDVLDTLQALTTQLKQETGQVKASQVKTVANTALVLKSLDEATSHLKKLLWLFSEDMP